MNDRPAVARGRNDDRIAALRKLEETLRHDAWERALAELTQTCKEPPTDRRPDADAPPD